MKQLLHLAYGATVSIFVHPFIAPALLFLLFFLPAKNIVAQIEFVLVDAFTNQDIQTIHNGDVLVESQLPDQLNIRADLQLSAGQVVQYVIFGFNGRWPARRENAPPYALGGDGLGDYFDLNIPYGANHVNATAYDAQGNALVSGSVSFNFLEASSGGNHPPQFSVSEEWLSVLFCVGEVGQFQLSATDPDDDPLTYSLAPNSPPLPNYLSLDSQSGLLHGLAATAVGSSTFFDVIVQVTDPGGLSATLPVVIGFITCGLPQAVISFTLVDATTNADIETFTTVSPPDQSYPFLEWQLDLSQLPPNLNIRANINPIYAPYLESVKFTYATANGSTKQRIENSAPYSLGGDFLGDYNPFNFSVGEATLSVQSFAANNAGGAMLGEAIYAYLVITNGGNNYSQPNNGVITAMNSTPGKLRAYPNPFAADLTIELDTPDAGRYLFELSDALGRKVYSNAHQLDGGLQQIRIEPDNWPGGVYFLQVRKEGAAAFETLRLVYEP